MSFSADLVSDSGRIVAPGADLTTGTSLTPYFDVSLSWSFIRYLDELLLPYWKAKRGTDRAALVAEASLESIGGWLSTSPDVAVTTNRDDLILEPADLDFLGETFGARATIHPHGGHCGNLEFAPVVGGMLQFLQEPWPDIRRGSP